MALYQAVRPTKLEQVLGNKSTVEMLLSIVKAKPQRRPHAILFQGPKGCGKTTFGRLLAKGIGCNDIEIIETNAANTRGIDTIRNVAESALARPMFGEAKAYIFDESHQLTPAAQQTLLKVTEDAPVHSYFIFCTTDPDKLIPTLRDRCTKFTVTLLRKPDMRVLLKTTAENAKISIADAVLDAIADAAEGTPRTALVMLEQVQDVTDPAAAIQCIKDLVVDGKESIDLARELISERSNRWAVCAPMITKLVDDPERARLALLTYLRKALLSELNIEKADRLAQMIRLFEPSTFTGGAAQFARAVFEATCI